MRIIDKLNAARAWDTSLPNHVKRTLFGSMNMNMSFAGSEVSFGESDYSSIEKVRKALDWLVMQMGGEITWEEEDIG